MSKHNTNHPANSSSPLQLKILFLSHSFYPEIGGIESISEILATAFTKAGHHVRLITWSHDPEAKKFPFEVVRKPSNRRLFKEHAWADILFENNPCLRLAWMGIFFKRKSIIALQTWITRMDGGIGLQDKLKFAFLNRARCVIACSKAILDKYAPSGFVIGNPYKDDIFKPVPTISKTKDFVFLGRLVSDKGADIILQAFNRLLTEDDANYPIPANLSLTICGDGPDRSYLENMVSEFGLEKNVVFTGPLKGEAVVNCLNKHRFIIVPSRWEEPFGIVALEGMACGCLPIVSNAGGLPDAVGAAGLLFKKADVDALVKCIRKILNDPGEEKRIREETSAHLNAFHAAEVSKQYLNLFQNVYLNAV